MRILVTGAGGFAGQHLLNAISRHFGARAAITAIAFRTARRVDPFPQAAETIAADLRDHAAVEAVVRRVRPDVTLNLAAISSVPDAMADASAAYEVNAVGAIKLGQAVADAAPRSLFVQASTADIYGRSFWAGDPVIEDAAVSPQNPYGRSKLAAEYGLRDTVAGACRVVALRLSNHLGQGQDERFVAAAFAAQIARIEAGLSPPVLHTGTLTAERDFLDIDDVVRAYIALIERETDQAGFALYNVASGQSRSIQSVLDGLLRLSSAPIQIGQDPARMRANDIPIARISTAAFRAATGWSPHTPFEDSLRSVLEDWRGRVRTPESARST